MPVDPRLSLALAAPQQQGPSVMDMAARALDMRSSLQQQRSNAMKMAQFQEEKQRATQMHGLLDEYSQVEAGSDAQRQLIKKITANKPSIGIALDRNERVRRSNELQAKEASLKEAEGTMREYSSLLLNIQRSIRKDPESVSYWHKELLRQTEALDPDIHKALSEHLILPNKDEYTNNPEGYSVALSEYKRDMQSLVNRYVPSVDILKAEQAKQSEERIALNRETNLRLQKDADRMERRDKDNEAWYKERHGLPVDQVLTGAQKIQMLIELNGARSQEQNDRDYADKHETYLWRMFEVDQAQKAAINEVELAFRGLSEGERNSQHQQNLLEKSKREIKNKYDSLRSVFKDSWNEVGKAYGREPDKIEGASGRLWDLSKGDKEVIGSLIPTLDALIEVSQMSPEAASSLVLENLTRNFYILAPSKDARKLAKSFRKYYDVVNKWYIEEKYKGFERTNKSPSITILLPPDLKAIIEGDPDKIEEFYRDYQSEGVDTRTELELAPAHWVGGSRIRDRQQSLGGDDRGEGVEGLTGIWLLR